MLLEHPFFQKLTSISDIALLGVARREIEDKVRDGCYGKTFGPKYLLDKQSNRQITEENSSSTILKHVKSVESVFVKNTNSRAM